jgi:hypothetical protein
MTRPKPPASRPRTGAPRRTRRWILWLAGLAGLVASIFALALLRLGVSPSEAWRAARESQPIEIVRYAEYRLLGHPTLEAVLLPILQAARRQIEREPPPQLADLGKGQRPGTLASPAYDAAGIPLPSTAEFAPGVLLAAPREVRSADELAEAMSTAEAGAVIEIAPGNYGIERTLRTARAGRAGLPITVRAPGVGVVVLEVRVDQAIAVTQPYWVFENLTLRGACATDSECEHAFHVAGAARATVIRNNRLENFNAHVKINGEDGNWPDDGLLQFNTLLNDAARRTSRPVSSVDLVGANGWQVVDNRVEGFVKTGGNGVSFGIFMKGGGERGRIERNVVVCTPRDISQPGVRVGISFGGGGTGPSYCRRSGCDAEHMDGVVANNIVAHCNDAGIDVHRSQRTLVAHNTLVNTRGVLVRDTPSDAHVAGNLLEGSVRERRGGQAREADNHVESRLADVLVAPDALDVRWRDLPPTLERLANVARDFCGRVRPMANTPGATLAASCVASRP